MGLRSEIASFVGLYLTIEGIISILEVVPLYQHIGPNADPVAFVRVLGDVIVKMAVPSPFTIFIMMVAILLGIKNQ